MIHSKLIAETSSKLTSTDITKIPKSLEEVQQFPGEVEIKTVQYENFLCINDKLIVFTCLSNLRFLVYMDGTFDCCTKYFLQLFTIFVLANDTYVPVAFGC
jgi:hypothetical protein